MKPQPRLLLPLLALLLMAAPARAQHGLLTGYDWEAAPVLPDTVALGQGTDLLLKRNSLTQHVEEGDNVVCYQVFHLQRYLHDAKAVNENKTIQVGTGHIHDIITLKARSVAPDGKVTELGKDAFKTSTDDGNRSSGIYFAFEGLRPGSIVEYLMLSKQRADFRGDATRLQFGIPVVEQRFELLVPSEWKFVFKGYNGAPVPEVDTTHAGVTRHHLLLSNTPALEDENDANTASYRMYLVYRLDAIPSRGIRDISNYVTGTRTYHSALYPEPGAKTKKELAALLKKMKLGYARDLEDRIRTMDRYLQGNFRTTETGGAGLADLDQVLRTGTCNEFGLQRLYCALFREAGVEHQVVVTTDRETIPFDPEFEAYNYLRTVCFYFPEVDKFLDPTEAGLGLGYLAPENMGTHGLFIRNMDLGGMFTGIGSIKPIPELPAEATRHDLRMTVELSDDASEVAIDVENTVTGYYARNIQNFYPYMNEEQRTDLVHAYLDHFVEGATKQDLQVEYAEARWFGVKPFTFKGKVVSPKFTNRAGDEVLLRVGDLIGPQVEMYAEKQRKLPVDSDHNRYYERSITIRIPAGWACADLSPLSIHKVMEIDGGTQAEFRSSARLEGDTITVDCIEYYRRTHVPVEHFEAYRAVINAAADFNKRALLLSPAD